MRKKGKGLLISAGVLTLFSAGLTFAAGHVDVRPIGPLGARVGFAALNGFVFRFIGARVAWYHITDWLGILAVLTAFGFAVLGLVQLIRRGSLLRVDRRILILGGFYLLLLGVYLFFERHIINFRPVLMGGRLEASFPSSHTMIVFFIAVTAMDQFHALMEKGPVRTAADLAACALMAVTVVGRLISGVHWFTDILAGLVMASALSCAYFAAVRAAGAPPYRKGP
jgi:undecaprenyl-diphosphatase